MSTTRLTFVEVVKHYETGADVVRAVDGVSLSVAAGETVVLLGPSGSGKSTLLKLAGGISAPDAGSVLVDGREVPNRSPSAAAMFRRREVGFVTQKPKLTPGASAVENAAIKLALDGASRRDSRRRATRMLEDVGLGDRLTHEPARLSGGEQQRVAIARALLNDPLVVLADEPTAHLDSATGRQIFGLLADYAGRRGAALVIVSHDEQAERFADRVLHLRDGRLRD